VNNREYAVPPYVLVYKSGHKTTSFFTVQSGKCTTAIYRVTRWGLFILCDVELSYYPNIEQLVVENLQVINMSLSSIPVRPT
jgi:hypothetical protein